MNEGFLSLFTYELLSSSIRLATPIILAALGGALCNKAGVLNLALESKMLLGAFVGIVAAYYLGNSYLGLLVAMLFGALLGLLFAFLYHQYQVDLIILAIAFNLIIAELTVFVMRVMFGNVGSWSDPSIVRIPNITIPWISKIPVLGQLLSGYNIIVYFSWFITIVMAVILYKTKFGRHIRAVGENKEAAITVGIKARMIQTLALSLSGALAALGGAYLSIGHLKLFTRNMSSGRGWTAIAAAIFGGNNPIGTFFASLFFGFSDAFSLRVQNMTNLPSNIVEMLPNVATLLVLVIIALRMKIGLKLRKSRFKAKLKSEPQGSDTHQ